MAHTGTELLQLLPGVLRARDFHLYLDGGKRITDLWRWGGRAVLGHKPPKVLMEMKNAAERGLFCPLPHPLQQRFTKALLEFFPGRAFRLYRDESSLRRALADAGLVATAESALYDPVFPQPATVLQGNEPAKVSLWRPFLAVADTAIVDPAVLVPVLPCPLGPAALVLPAGADTSFPPGDIIPPVLLAAAARALYNLAAVQKSVSANRDWPDYPKLRKALSAPRQTGQCTWQRRGIYLTLAQPDMDGEKYEALFRRFLEGGFLIPPEATEPLILPLTMSAGEEAKLAQILAI